MPNKLSNILKKYANGWLVLIFLAGYIFFNALILPGQQAKIESGSGGVGPIDLQLFYTPDKVYGMIQAYSPEVRASYRLFEMTGDVIYPIVYTLFLSLAITWLFQRGFASTSIAQTFNVIPFGSGLFDLLENICVITMLTIYPSIPPALVWISAVFTFVKWSFAGIAILVLLTGLIMAIKNGFKKQS